MKILHDETQFDTNSFHIGCR